MKVDEVKTTAGINNSEFKNHFKKFRKLNLVFVKSQIINVFKYCKHSLCCVLDLGVPMPAIPNVGHFQKHL